MVNPCLTPQECKEALCSKEKNIESLGTNISDTPPPALRVSKFCPQALGKDLDSNVDASPPTSEGKQVNHPTNILVLDSQEPIVARGFGT